MLKKLVCLFLVLIFLVTMVGCGVVPAIPSAPDPELVLAQVTDPKSNLVSLAGMEDSDVIAILGDKDNDGNLVNATGVAYVSDQGDSFGMDIGEYGLPSYLIDSEGNKVIFENYTDSTVDISIYDSNDNLVQGTTTIELDSSDLLTIKQLYESLYSQKGISLNYKNTLITLKMGSIVITAISCGIASVGAVGTGGLLTPAVLLPCGSLVASLVTAYTQNTFDDKVVTIVSGAGSIYFKTASKFTGASVVLGALSSSIELANTMINLTPTITSIPVTSATVGQLYSYDVKANDPNSDVLSYSLSIKPSGMEIAPTGFISWIPTVSGIFDVTIEVSDGELSGTQSFTITVEEAENSTGQVQLSNPLNGATVNTSTVVLSWNPVVNANGYEIVYDTSSNFTNPIGWTVSGTFQKTGTLNDEVTYYWRVRAFIGDQYSSWSPVWSFTKSGTTPQLPLPPTGLLVSSYWNTTSLGFPSMTISWNAVSGATGYEMYVRFSGGSSTYLGTRDAPYVSFNSNSLPGGIRYVSGTTYYFKVRTITASGVSAFTNEVSCVAASGPSITIPNPPTSLSPGTTSAPGPIISTLTPTLSWAVVPNADYYNLSVSIYPYGSSNIIFYNQQIYGNSITIPSGYLQPGQKYRWNMRAYNSAGYSDYSDTFYFQTESTQSVTLTLYICKNSTSGTPLSGVSVGVVDGGGKGYSHTTNSSGYVTITGTPGTWNFTAMKSGYDTNSWSQSITTNCTKYGYLIESALPVGTVDIFATLNGSPWVGSLNYSLTGPSNTNGSNVPDILNNKSIGTYSITYNYGGPSNTLLSSITPSSTQTLSAGNIIAFTFNFVSQVPSLGQVLLVSPSNGASLPPMNVTFIWNSVSNATKYQFVLYNSKGQVALDTIKTSTYIPVSLGIEETITWKVRAGDNSGNWGPWSDTWSLTIVSL
jgi:hypothetical protein